MWPRRRSNPPDRVNIFRASRWKRLGSGSSLRSQRMGQPPGNGSCSLLSAGRERRFPRCAESAKDGARFGSATPSHVNCFDKAAATVARFHADVLKFVGGVDGKLRVILLAATGTDDSAELPLRQTK